MNYRHAFHAGNFGDCLKHALLVWLIDALQRKPTPIAVLDTHAGAGQYDLDAGPAQRTNEWRHGIGRLLDNPPPPLARYVNLVREIGLYPGSPALVRAMLRPDDQLICCELHPEDTATLRRNFARDPRVAVHHRDAWEALGALLPPKPRRGLTLIDPPFEKPSEFAHLVNGLRAGHARFATGVFAAWYPIKHRAPVRDFHAALRQAGMRDIVAAELCLRPPTDPDTLNGCGVVVINPPWQFEAAAEEILRALRVRLADGASGAETHVIRLADE